MQLVRESFEIFINTPEYQEGIEELESIFEDLKKLFLENEALDQVIASFTELRNAFTVTRSGGIAKTSKGFKALNMGGKTPTYMRPPFGSCYEGSGCLSDMGKMGYHVIDWNIDSLDWMYCADEWTCAQAVATFDEQFYAGAAKKIGFNVLSHDTKEFTASVLLPHMLKRAKQAGYKVVTVGECLNDPKENWYKKW